VRNFKTGAWGWYCDPNCRMAIVAVELASVPPREHSRTNHGEVRHKDVLVEFLVLHKGFLSPKTLPLPTQIPDGPNFFALVSSVY
jgi:hypothetical protein